MTALLRRLRVLIALEAGFSLARPLFWFWVGLMALMALANVDGSLGLIASGDSATGGKKAFVTSEFAFASLLGFLLMVVCPFFYAIPAGLSVARDDEERVGEILNATALRPGQYIWGKFAGVLLVGVAALVLYGAATIVFNHVIPRETAQSVRGPFVFANYARPLLWFGLPYLIALGGSAFAVGAITRQTILTFLMPFASIIASSLLASWSNARDLSVDTRILLSSLEPSGFLWLSRTYTQVDRGVDFYNTQPIGYDSVFLGSRLLLAAFGLGCVLLAHLHRRASVRKPTRASATRRAGAPAVVQQQQQQTWALTPAAAPMAPVIAPPRPTAPLSALEMRSRAPGIWRGALTVARAEAGELLRKPGLYLFLLFLVLFSVANQSDKSMMFGTKVLQTPGLLAQWGMAPLAVMVTLLTLVYGVDTLERDRATRFAAVGHALPVRSLSLLLGKWLGLQIVVLSVVLTQFTVAFFTVASQDAAVPMTLTPFALLWGALLLPAFAMWTLFLFAVYTVTGHNRYATYAVALTVLMYLLTEPRLLTYFSNPFLMGSVRWSDLSLLEADRPVLVVSRVFLLGLAALYAAIAARQYRRRERDVARTVGRLRVGTQMRLALGLIPFLVIPLAFGWWTRRMVATGVEGPGVEERMKDYWRKNVATYKDAPVPGVQAVDMALDLHPETLSYSGKGTMTLVNHLDEPLPRIPITPGFFWKNVTWTVEGEEWEPENRSGLAVFHMDPPLAPGQTVTIGFAYEAPDSGVTRNGGGGMEFFLPSGVVLTSFTESFAPYVGYIESVGVDEDNRSDPPDHPVGYHERRLGALFGSPTPMDLRLAITAPENWTINSAGTKVSDRVRNGRRTTVWEAKRGPRTPLRDFNVVGGPNLKEKRGKLGTVVYYHPAHAYNVDEMLEALEKARTHYSDWFAPYPWPELRLTEFPSMADYAQSFPANITFSESMGFLTVPSPSEGNDAFAVAAHEAAHQWWGHLVVPGDGPGGNVLSEGLAHFATMLLIDTVKGDSQRQRFLKTIERQYLEARSADSELPLSRLTGGKHGDGSVTYDRGGFVFAMLADNVMGRENMLRGLREFVARYRDSDDHPLLPDLTATLRPHAPDKRAFDAFVAQWIDGTALPAFRISDVKRAEVKTGKGKSAKAVTEVTFRVTNEGTGADLPVVVALKSRVGGILSTRRVVVPAGDKGVTCTIRTEHEPASIVVDPGVRVLQAGRDHAVFPRSGQSWEP